MSTTTPNLGLFKYNPTTDANLPFNIVTALNNNWDILDSSGGSSRNIGEIVTSTIPLTDAGLHSLDGSLIDGTGIYSNFVTYMAELYNTDPTANYFAQAQHEVIEGWTQPTLSSNGTMGGDSFACEARSFTNVYRAFNSTNTENVYGDNTNTETITFYNPNKLKVTSIVWNVFDADRNPLNYTVQGSNDGSTYTSIITNQTASAGASTAMDLSSNTDFYNYYKIIVNSFNTGQGNLKTLVISATQMVAQELTAEQVWQESVANYGFCDKFVYNSTNNTVRLPKRTEKHGKLIDSYSSGTTWYRIYEDGFCEQGDYIATPISNHEGTITFPKAFENTNYTILFTGKSMDNNSYYADNVNIAYNANKTTNSIRISAEQNNTNLIVSWQAYGYTDISRYKTSTIYEYIILANIVKTGITVDIDEIATDLNNKADLRDMMEVQCVVETYHSGTSWYRVYSDGWCEQGGRFTKTSNPTYVSFLKPFKNTNYTVNSITFLMESSSKYEKAAYVSKETNRLGVSIGSYNNQVGNTDTIIIDWTTSGYIL